MPSYIGAVRGGADGRLLVGERISERQRGHASGAERGRRSLHEFAAGNGILAHASNGASGSGHWLVARPAGLLLYLRPEPRERIGRKAARRNDLIHHPTVDELLLQHQFALRCRIHHADVWFPEFQPKRHESVNQPERAPQATNRFGQQNWLASYRRAVALPSGRWRQAPRLGGLHRACEWQHCRRQNHSASRRDLPPWRRSRCDRQPAWWSSPPLRRLNHLRRVRRPATWPRPDRAGRSLNRPKHRLKFQSPLSAVAMPALRGARVRSRVLLVGPAALRW